MYACIYIYIYIRVYKYVCVCMYIEKCQTTQPPGGGAPVVRACFWPPPRFPLLHNYNFKLQLVIESVAWFGRFPRLRFIALLGLNSCLLVGVPSTRTPLHMNMYMYVRWCWMLNTAEYCWMQIADCRMQNAEWVKMLEMLFGCAKRDLAYLSRANQTRRDLD